MFANRVEVLLPGFDDASCRSIYCFPNHDLISPWSAHILSVLFWSDGYLWMGSSSWHIPFQWGDRPGVSHSEWDGLPCSRRLTLHLPGYFCMSELLTLSPECLLGSEHTAPAHRAVPREPGSSRACKNHSQAPMGGSCLNIPSVTNAELNFISQVTSAGANPSLHCPLWDPLSSEEFKARPWGL